MLCGGVRSFWRHVSLLQQNSQQLSALPAVYHVRPKATSVSPQQANIDDVPKMPPCDFTPQPYKGPSYESILKTRKAHVSPGYLTYYKQPLLAHQGHMQWLFDHEGRRYLDMFAGIVTVSVGHCHPKVTAALEDQLSRLWHTTNIYMHAPIHEYAEKLAAKMPGNLKVVYFTNSGSEANDLAMVMARLYTGKYDILSFRNGFHGASPNLMGVTALSSWRYPFASGFGVQQTMNPDVYRGPWGGAKCRDSPNQTNRSCSCAPGECEANKNYLEQLADVIRYSLPKDGMAGFFAEPIQGVGGTVQYPTGYLKGAFDMVREKGGVCISDEVQAGFGRTGDHYWGFQAHDVIPDIVTMAKGMGNGFPLAAVVTTPEIAATMSKALHFNTYGGNPMASVVGSTVLDVIDEDGCQALSKDVGTYLLTQLAPLREEFGIVGDVRGKGLMIGIELVKDKKSKDPLPIEEVNAIWEDCKDLGVLLGKGGVFATVLRMKPPMCVTRDDADFSVAVLRKALTNHMAKK